MTATRSHPEPPGATRSHLPSHTATTITAHTPTTTTTTTITARTIALPHKTGPRQTSQMIDRNAAVERGDAGETGISRITSRVARPEAVGTVRWLPRPLPGVPRGRKIAPLDHLTPRILVRGCCRACLGGTGMTGNAKALGHVHPPSHSHLRNICLEWQVWVRPSRQKAVLLWKTLSRLHHRREPWCQFVRSQSRGGHTVHDVSESGRVASGVAVESVSVRAPFAPAVGPLAFPFPGTGDSGPPGERV